MSTTLQAASAIDAHTAAFTESEHELLRGARPALQRLRKSAIANFGEIGFPTERNEDWKFTSVAPIVRTPFLLPPPEDAETANTLRTNLIHEGPGATLFSADTNRPFLLRGSQPLPEGVLVMSLAEALVEHPELVEPHLGQHADFKSHPFVALNTAFWRDGAFVYVPPGKVVEAPIQLSQVVAAFNKDAPYLWYRRALIVLGRGSQATVVESYSGPGVTYATNAVSEIVLGEGAVLDHYKVQEEPTTAFHLACTQVVQARSSNFSTHYIGFGGSLVRNEVRVLFTGEGAEATVNGLYQASGTQHADNSTVIDHAKPHCASHELYKGILDGKARGVFNGRIFVRQDAQKTDAKQTNQTLLLSDDATINTKPQLEIYADDVKCTHGATVGQLSEEQTFYLRSRGLGLEEARALLTFAFANDVINRIKVSALRERLERILLEVRHLPGVENEES
jgi:Fe-S cluster assembly protein SufD